MKVGQTVRARFRSLPDSDAGERATTEKRFPLRSAVVVYIHPKWRFITLATETGGGTIKESFPPMEVIRKEK